eukprot:929029-Pelagomonas_calceolata.AAC.1
MGDSAEEQTRLQHAGSSNKRGKVEVEKAGAGVSKWTMCTPWQGEQGQSEQAECDQGQGKWRMCKPWQGEQAECEQAECEQGQ